MAARKHAPIAGMTALGWLADRGPWVLIAGILAGLTQPSLAQSLVPFIPLMVAGLVFMAALRIGPERMVAALTDMPATIARVLIMQLALPLAVVALLSLLDGLDHPVGLALLIVVMAPAITGSPNMVLMMGYDPAISMRYMVTGTVLLPLTVIPVLIFLPSLGSLQEVLLTAGKLLIVISVSGFLAFVVRSFFLPSPSRRALKSIDGVSTLLMGAVVIGLMSAVSEALLLTTGAFFSWLGLAFVVSFGLQVLAYRFTSTPHNLRAALAVANGNRSIALFLVALPTEVMAPLLVFVGCYQVPMYLTPLVTGAVLKRLDPDA